MLFIFSPKNRKAIFTNSFALDGEGKEEQNGGRRQISFEAEFKTPRTIYLATGGMCDLANPDEHGRTTMDVTIGEHDGSWELKDRANPSFIGVSNGGSCTVRLILEHARFDEILQSIRAGEHIRFTIIPPNKAWLQYSNQPPPILLDDKTGTRLRDHEIFWRNDVSPLVDIESVTYTIGFGADV